MESIRVLLVEDSDLDAELIGARLREEGFAGDLVRVQTPLEFRRAVEGRGIDVILSDYSLPEFDGSSALALAQKLCPETPFIFVSGMLGEQIAIDVLKRGATDYVLKERMDRLGTAIRQALAQRREREARERAQAELRAAKEAAEAANRAKDRFMAVLSHELRTPLSPILATVHALELEQELPAHVRDALEVIKRNAELEARLIDDLLDITRVTRGKLKIHPCRVDLHSLVHRAVEIVRHGLEGKRHAILLDLRASNPMVNADPARLQQIFWNLLQNAVKFTPTAGRIELRSRDDAEGRVVVEVEDSGIGISPEALPRIFQVFEQAGDQITQRYGGLGLGLTIAHSLARLHGAAMEAFSDGVGRGAMFRLTMPRPDGAPVVQDGDETPLGKGREVPAVAASAMASTVISASGAAVGTTLASASASAAVSSAQRVDGQGRRLRILLVEDHADTARAMGWLLRRKGHEVSVAHSVRHAVDEAHSGGPFDLLISDIGLPDGTGWDVIRQMPRPNMPAIALTGFGMEHDVARSIEAGFTEHLTKPVNFQKLEAVILNLSNA